MKQVTLNFREVAVDGLPEESCEVLTLSGQARNAGIVDHFYNIVNTGFSKKHGRFNSCDYLEENPDNVFSNDVLFWVPMSEVNAIFKDGETP